MSKLKSSNETKNINKTELVNQSIDYMIQHMSDELTVKEVADYFHYSEFYFNLGNCLLTSPSYQKFCQKTGSNKITNFTFLNFIYSNTQQSFGH